MLNSLAKRRLPFVVFDAIFIILAVYFSFFLRFEGDIPAVHLPNILGAAVFSLIFCLPTFYFFKLYSFSWVYVGAEDLVSLVKAQIFSFLLLSAAIFILRDWPVFLGFPRSTLFISFVLIFFFCGSIRFSKRIALQFFKTGQKEKDRTLIVGAGNAGEQILRNILNSKDSPYFPVGFVDDNPQKQGLQIHGLKILGRINDIPKIAQTEKIQSLIIAMPSAGAKVIRGAVELGRKAQLKKIKIVPAIADIISGQVTLSNLKELEMEDLLGRDPAVLDQKLIENFIQNKTVLITGAAGSIGSELCRQIAKFNPASLLILDQDETGVFNVSEEMFDNFPKLKIKALVADILDGKKLEQIFEQFRPSVVFHAAAYKHVPLMEGEPDEAIKNNVFGTKRVSETAKKYKTEKFVFISTDKAVKPTSVMGASKRLGEIICRAQNGETKFISVRFGNVLDSRGSVIPIFREQIKKGGPVQVTHPDMKRYFMTTAEACLLVMQASAMGQGGEVFVLDMGIPIKILDLAREMIRLSGLEPDKDIAIVFTKPRPGEKLFEEILTAEEGTVATQNQRIFIAKLLETNKDKLDSCLKKLKEAVDLADKKYIIETLKEIIPSYRSGVY